MNNTEKLLKEKKESQEIINEIVDLEIKCHNKNKEKNRLNSAKTELYYKYILPENKLLSELLKRKIELKEQLLKIKRDILYEKSLEFKRKRDYRRTIPDIIDISAKIKIANEEENNLFKRLNELGEKYPTEYNKGWELYKLKRDNKEI